MSQNKPVTGVDFEGRGLRFKNDTAQVRLSLPQVEIEDVLERSWSVVGRYGGSVALYHDVEGRCQIIYVTEVGGKILLA